MKTSCIPAAIRVVTYVLPFSASSGRGIWVGLEGFWTLRIVQCGPHSLEGEFRIVVHRQEESYHYLPRREATPHTVRTTPNHIQTSNGKKKFLTGNSITTAD
jgi:hypothetical protein